MIDFLNTIRNPTLKANEPKDMNDLCDNDSDDDFDDDEDGFGDESAIDQLRKTFEPKTQSSKSQ